MITSMLYHLYDDSIRVAVWHETRKGASACHPEPAAVVEDDQVCTALLDELGREPDARACTEDNIARVYGATQ